MKINGFIRTSRDVGMLHTLKITLLHTCYRCALDWNIRAMGDFCDPCGVMLSED